jgi:hypothetical protein
MRASVTVTAAAMPTVRNVIVRYVSLCQRSSKFWNPQSWTTSAVKGSSRQKAAAKRTAREPRYATTSHPTGAASRSWSWSRGCR